jgi:hypothetical protein
VRSLGSSILGALERRDAEELARVRSTQEITLLQAIHAVKRVQLAEAKAQRTTLEASREAAALRRDYLSPLPNLRSLPSTAPTTPVYTPATPSPVGIREPMYRLLFAVTSATGESSPPTNAPRRQRAPCWALLRSRSSRGRGPSAL